MVQTYAALNKSQSEELNALRQKDLAHARREIELVMSQQYLVLSIGQDGGVMDA